jgi:RHH-type proline utilization regulon transcriptional repressor/proline dehydrogenase/delta 1-pyrroline-5-carboxylate dehydrogenase
VKLSALSPRYEPTQEVRVWDELYPRVLRLAEMAAKADINFTLDAEEADRLVLSLKLLDRLAREPSLGGWRGLGLAVQAYQKRAPDVITALAVLAKESGRRLMVRLVKGAYWDSEIKRAQVAGRPGYPVFTTKPATDLSYLVCAQMLVDAAPHLYAQFATHNAHTLAAVRAMADAVGVKIEHQRLHGMGEALYDAAERQYGPLSLRTYAPVGAHEDLLPYLVRRLLENGANTSFVHLLLDDDTPVETVAVDPITLVEGPASAHSAAARPVWRPAEQPGRRSIHRGGAHDAGEADGHQQAGCRRHAGTGRCRLCRGEGRAARLGYKRRRRTRPNLARHGGCAGKASRRANDPGGDGSRQDLARRHRRSA